MEIKKIFEGNFDDETHNAFLKFGKGTYPDRYLIQAKKQSKNYSIKTSYEFANYFVRKCLAKLPGSTQIKGIISTTLNLGSDEQLGFPVKKRSNFQGVKKLIIDAQIEPQKILRLIEQYPRVFYGLSFDGPDFSLKIKPKPPRSGKPGTKNEDKPKANFCTLKTNDPEILEELFFDYPNFKEISISHTIKIDRIVYPQNVASLTPEQIREQSKRHGFLIRNITADQTQQTKEKEFLV